MLVVSQVMMTDGRGRILGPSEENLCRDKK